MKLSNETSPIRKFFNFVRDDIQLESFTGETFENQELIESFKRYIQTLLKEHTLKPQTKVTYMKELKCFIKWCLENKEIINNKERENTARTIISTSIPDFINQEQKENFSEEERMEYSDDSGELFAQANLVRLNHYNLDTSFEKEDEEDQTEDAKDESFENYDSLEHFPAYQTQFNNQDVQRIEQNYQKKNESNFFISIPSDNNVDLPPLDETKSSLLTPPKDPILNKKQNIRKRNSPPSININIQQEERKRKNSGEIPSIKQDEGENDLKKLKLEETNLINQEIYLLKESYQKSLDIISILEKKNILIEQKLQTQQIEIDKIKDNFVKEIESLKQLINEKKELN
jgi:uncharacterized protein YciW